MREIRVLMIADRMLVRVGYHEKDGLGLFNEYVQVRRLTWSILFPG